MSHNSDCFAWVLLILLSLYPGLNSTAQDREGELSSFIYEAVHIAEDFEITGRMDHPAWDSASATRLSYQIEPNDQKPAPVTTSVKVLYSTYHLYIGFMSEDPEPGKIRANITDRDGFFGDDFVAIILDTYNNNQQAYEFMVNPVGVQMDATRQGNSEDFSYDALWYSEAALTGEGYTAVMKIPFKSFNFPDSEVQDWSIQFLRNYPRENRYLLSWTQVSLDNSCMLCQNGLLAKMEHMERAKTVELLPYAAANQSGALNDPLNPDAGFNNDPIEAKVGGSISYNPTTNSSLEAVINPDFSQVETDAAQISVNETFALYYSEKRPFFVKGSDLFSTPENLYYSRTINNPLAAAKYTQKSDNFSVAFLTAYDRNAPFIIPGRENSSQIRTGMEAYNNILRGKYNIGNESYVGGLVTTRNQSEGHNYVGSVDWDLLVSSNYYFRGQLAYSNTLEPDDLQLHDDPRRFGDTKYDAAFNGQQYSGALINTEFAREAKYYNFEFEYSSYSPTLQTQTGFINRTNRREFSASQRISYYPDGDLLSQGSLSLYGNWRYDFEGQFMERFMFVRLNNRLTGQNSIYINFLPVNDERFRGTMFRNLYRGTIGFRSNTWDVISFSGRFGYGRNINRSIPSTLGVGFDISADATFKPTPRLQVSLDYNYSRLSAENGSQTYYKGDIYRLTTRYNFSKKFFARIITEYNSFSSEIQLYPLFYYKANAFTKFYIGMTSYRREFENTINDGFRGYHQTHREFFVKFQYLIRS